MQRIPSFKVGNQMASVSGTFVCVYLSVSPQKHAQCETAEICVAAAYVVYCAPLHVCSRTKHQKYLTQSINPCKTPGIMRPWLVISAAMRLVAITSSPSLPLSFCRVCVCVAANGGGTGACEISAKIYIVYAELE